ncbi:MAG: T9SS type A sorting domain-containing protein, partial [bacterium]
ETVPSPVIPVLSPRFNGSELEIYPNPAFDFVKIKSSQKELIRSVQLVNMAGQILFESHNINAIEMEIPTGSIQTGIYLIRVLTESSSTSRKIQILQR